MKVLLVGDYPPPYGGIAVQVQHLAQVLPEAGVECRVLNIGRGRRVPSSEYQSVHGPMDFLLKLTWWGRRGYLLHLFTNGENWKSWGIAFTVGLVGKVLGAPAIVTITSGGMPTYLAGAGFWNRALARLAVRLPAAVICRTDAIAQSMRVWRSTEVSVIPAFSLSRLRAAEHPPEAVANFASGHRPLLVSVAILRWEYDLPTLLRAFQDLRKEYPGAGLIIVGGGEDDTQVRDLVSFSKLSDSVLLTGWVPYNECLATIREADVFVRTTLYDGDASSVREALALGVPVVASRTDFRPEGVICFPPGDPGALRSKLLDVLTRRERRTILDVPSCPPNNRMLLDVYHKACNDVKEGISSCVGSAGT